MACSAPLIVLTAVAFHAGHGIDLAVYFVLTHIISPVEQRPFRSVLVLVARLQLFLMRVAIRAEGFYVTYPASLLVLPG